MRPSDMASGHDLLWDVCLTRPACGSTAVCSTSGLVRHLTLQVNLQAKIAKPMLRGCKDRAMKQKSVRVWRNGRREGLKHPFRKECRFDSDHPHQIKFLQNKNCATHARAEAKAAHRRPDQRRTRRDPRGVGFRGRNPPLLTLNRLCDGTG